MKKLFSLGLLSIVLVLLSGITACSTSAGTYNRSGEKCFKKGDYEAAVLNFSKAVTENPNRSDYIINYGMALAAEGRYEEAVEQFDKVIRNKNILLVRQNNKRALRGKGIACYGMERYKEALECFDAALEINELSSLNMDILYYKGRALIKTESYTEAVQIYSRIIDESGEDAAAYAQRAHALYKAGEYGKSLEDFDMALSLAPGSFSYCFGKYKVYLSMGDEAGAAEVLTQAASIEAGSARERFNLARVHFYQGLYKQAREEFGECLAEGFIESNFYIGESYYMEKDYSTAVFYYDKYIKDGAAGYPEVYNQAACSKMKLGEYEEAIKYLNMGKDIGDKGLSKALRMNEIVAYEYLGRFDKALEKLEEYIAEYPDDNKAERERDFLLTRQADITSRDDD